MNIYSLLGFLMAIGVLVSGVVMSTDKYHIFIDHIAFVLVIGGTFAATAISFQLDRLFVLFKFFLSRVLGTRRTNFQDIIKELMKICEDYRQGESFDALSNKSKDPFLKDALVLASDDIVSEKELLSILQERCKNMHYHNMEEAGKVKSIAKYPPAFGLMGTSLGMVVLLSNLGGTDALKTVGPAMGICLTATLYGIILANLVIFPISEHLVDASKEVELKNRMIIEGIRLMLLKTSPIIVAERLNSFLQPGKRLDWKKALGK